MRTINQNTSSKKIRIKEVVVVEGKTDTSKLKSIFDVDTIETNGSRLSKTTIQLIKKVSLNRGVILFLDPDGPGEQIRKRLEKELTNFKQIFIKTKDAFNGKKVGIAEASDAIIKKTFKDIKSFDQNTQSLSWEQYLSLNLSNQHKREIITNHYHLSPCNNKTLFKRLNMMGIKHNELIKLVHNQ